jgi:hypothetical protein
LRRPSGVLDASWGDDELCQVPFLVRRGRMPDARSFRDFFDWDGSARQRRRTSVRVCRRVCQQGPQGLPGAAVAGQLFDDLLLATLKATFMSVATMLGGCSLPQAACRTSFMARL